MYLILSFFTIISALVSLFYTTQYAWLTKSIISYYALSRSIAISLLSISILMLHNQTLLIVMAIIMVFVQILDGIVGLIDKNKFKTYGPFFTGFINAILLIIYLFNV
ncbi:hypothetical protein [Staphylococcus edaphicus]|uniref:Uncharacterized protein n=1 Tax=Staphylococcus edaphicus TaxID=1955013 RepID=A0A2C6WSF7_9STAP|nr:hypothetical protein [Staphylococcus edaphicus]PHK50686.1 hypothetical protein BTJ66_02270 [Staphylococcus edaphicus]UQW80644.1 hypothetical protein MNY58_08560 [Staphylococcus edaphicus]